MRMDAYQAFQAAQICFSVLECLSGSNRVNTAIQTGVKFQSSLAKSRNRPYSYYHPLATLPPALSFMSRKGATLPLQATTLVLLMRRPWLASLSIWRAPSGSPSTLSVPNRAATKLSLLLNLKFGALSESFEVQVRAVSAATVVPRSARQLNRPSGVGFDQPADPLYRQDRHASLLLL